MNANDQLQPTRARAPRAAELAWTQGSDLVLCLMKSAITIIVRPV